MPHEKGKGFVSGVQQHASCEASAHRRSKYFNISAGIGGRHLQRHLISAAAEAAQPSK